MNSKATPFFPRQHPDKEIVFPDEEVVWHFLSLENIPRQNSLQEVVMGLYDHQLSSLFRKIWKGPTGKFVSYFSLGLDKFVAYLSGKIKSHKYRLAVIRFLLQGREITISQEEDEPEITHTSIPDLVRQIMRCPTIKQICFIDGDNCPYVLSQILGLDHIFVICYMLRDRVTEHTHPWENSDRFVLRYSRTYSKEASDIRISTDGPMLSPYLPSTIRFCFITRDLFVQELVEVIRRDCDRPAICIDPSFRTTALALALLDDSEIRKYSPLFPLGAAVQNIKNIAETTVILPPERSGLFWQGNSFLLEQIRKADPLDLMVELAHLFHSEAFLLDKRIEDMTPEELKTQWRLHWRGQKIQFCVRYHVNRNEFFSFFKGEPSQSSEEAIRKFLGIVHDRSRGI